MKTKQMTKQCTAKLMFQFLDRSPSIKRKQCQNMHKKQFEDIKVLQN